MCLYGCSPRHPPSRGETGRQPDTSVQGCTGRLTALRVPRNAARVSGSQPASDAGPERPEIWAAVRLRGPRRAQDDVIVEVQTSPNDPGTWSQVDWSGGESVPGRPNQRRFPRDMPTVHRVVVTLCGDRRTIEIWILWADLELLYRPSDPLPPGAAPLPDGIRALGVARFPRLGLHAISPDDPGREAINARGCVIVRADLAPSGVGDVIREGWQIRREHWTHNFSDGAPQAVRDEPRSNWTTRWVDDTSPDMFLRRTPDPNGTIYDTDAPDMLRARLTSETNSNFRQWVEWNGQRCSDHLEWHWRAAWNFNAPDQLVAADVGPGNPPLPEQSRFPRTTPSP